MALSFLLHVTHMHCMHSKTSTTRMLIYVQQQSTFTWHGPALPTDPSVYFEIQPLSGFRTSCPTFSTLTTRAVDECLGPAHLLTSWRDGPRLASTKRLWSIRRNKTTPKAWASPRAMRVALVRNRRLILAVPSVLWHFLEAEPICR